MNTWFNIPTDYSDDERRIARLLYNVSTITFIIGLLILVLTPIYFNGRALSYGSGILITVFSFITPLFVQRGHLNLASTTLIASIWFSLTITLFIQSGVRHIAYSGYLIVIIMATLLLNRKAMVFIAVSTVIVSALMLIMDSANLIAPRIPPATTSSIWVINTIVIGVASAMLFLASRVIEGTVNRLHEQQERLNLEIEKHSAARETILELAMNNQQIATEYQSLFHQNNDAIFMIDLEGNYTSANRRTSELLGYTPEEITQLSFRDIVVPDQIKDGENVLERLIAGEQIPPYERKFRKKDGTIFPAEVNVELVRDANGNPAYIQSICRDISERKQHEAEQMQALITQERANVISNIVTAVSHDFRTPLATIHTSLYLLSRLEDQERREKQLERISNQTNVISQMVNNLIMLIKVSSDIELDKTVIQPYGLIENIVENFATTHPQASIKYQIIGDKPFAADYKLLREALTHLVNNAISHAHSDEPIEIIINSTDERVIIEVSDKGVGIDPELLDNIFQHFYRADSARRIDSNAANGLGLPIVKRIAELHHGRVDIKSVVDQGSTFRLILPT